MTDYEWKAYEETRRWMTSIERKSGIIEQLSRKAQMKVHKMIPEKVHMLLTDSIKKMVEATLKGSEYMTKPLHISNMTLKEREILLQKKRKQYERSAAAEGVGTGAGGIFLGMADFPLLLSIKMKFLFDSASVYGFDTREEKERIFLLYLFQLAYSKGDRKKEVLRKVVSWEDAWSNSEIELDWRQLQQEYRDYIDLVKMLQLIPGAGAIVGGVANYRLLQELGTVVKHGYRIRLMEEKKQQVKGISDY